MGLIYFSEHFHQNLFSWVFQPVIYHEYDGIITLYKSCYYSIGAIPDIGLFLYDLINSLYVTGSNFTPSPRASSKSSFPSKNLTTNSANE